MRKVKIKGSEYKLPKVMRFYDRIVRYTEIKEPCDVFDCNCRTDNIECNECLLDQSNNLALIEYLNNGESDR